MTSKHILMVAATMLAATSVSAETDTTQVAEKPSRVIELPSWLPRIGGTLRGKYEYQINEQASRFQVRNARLNFKGSIVEGVGYKAEVDFSDKGRMRFLDGYAEVQPFRLARKSISTDCYEAGKSLTFRLGQMRVPYGIDAHRSPHLQHFANRSFLAKQVGDVRDAGFTAAYTLPRFPLILEAGLFSGSGLTNQYDYWTRSLNFSAKAQMPFKCGLTLVGSVQKLSPSGGAVYLYDGGVTFQKGRWTIEAEYQRRHYANGLFHNVDAFNTFVCYDLPLRGALPKISFLARFDMMEDQSDGDFDVDKDGNSLGTVSIDDAARKRITAGVTLSLAKKLGADLRINYEKYFYDDIALAAPSERDKIVAELMIHF